MQFTKTQTESIYPKGVENHYWSQARNQIIADTLEPFAFKTMLEIGCGAGIVTKYLSSKGFNCSGVDLADGENDAYLRYNTDYRDFGEFTRETTQVVLLFDVIEHIEDDVTFLREIKDTFPNLTHIVVTVPARMELWSNFDEFNGHYRRYTIGGLEMDMYAAGLETISSSYFMHSLYLPAFLLRGNNRKTEMSVPSKATAWLHDLIAKFLHLESKLPSWLPGTSIISVLKVQ